MNHTRSASGHHNGRLRWVTWRSGGSCGVEPVVRGTAQSRATPVQASGDLERLDAPVQRTTRRATSSTKSRSEQKPHLPWATPTDMATAMAMPASAATGSSAGHDGRCCGAAAGRGGGGLGSGPGGGKITQEIPQLAVGSCGQGLSRSFVELLGREPARLEVLAQLRQDRVTVGVGSPHLSSGVILQRGVHRAAVLSSRERNSHSSTVLGGGACAPMPDATGRG